MLENSEMFTEEDVFFTEMSLCEIPINTQITEEDLRLEELESLLF